MDNVNKEQLMRKFHIRPDEKDYITDKNWEIMRKMAIVMKISFWSFFLISAGLLGLIIKGDRYITGGTFTIITITVMSTPFVINKGAFIIAQVARSKSRNKDLNKPN